jgi:hypothetical protein
MNSDDGFSLENVLRQMRAGPPTVSLEAALTFARASGWRFEGERPIELAVKLSLQPDDESAEGWTSYRAGQRASVRDALTEHLGHWPSRAEMAPVPEPELGAICGGWASGLRLAPGLREELEADFPAVLAASQVGGRDSGPVVEFHRTLWKAYANGMMPIGWDGRWPEGQLVVAYFE